MNWKIRIATKKDALTITQLYNSDNNLRGEDSTGYSLEDIEDYIKKDLMIVYEINKKIIGACLIELWKNYAYFHTIVVDKDFQGKGIGNALNVYVEEFLKKKNIHLIEAFTELDNKKAQTLLEKRGYQKGKLFIFYSKEI